MFHVPAHKNVTHPAGQVREPHGNGTDPANPDRPTDFPTAPREPKPRACRADDGGGPLYGTCFANVLKERIENR